MWLSFIGFMASGKTTISEVMHRGMGLPVVDLDHRVEELAACSVPEIFQTQGLTAFRALEAEALAVLPAAASLLVATGGGCVETPRNAEILQGRGVVLWLDAPWEVLRRRIENGGVDRRPMVAHLGWDGLQRLYRRRAVLYAHVANFRLRTDRGTVASVARQALLRSLVWQGRCEGSTP